ncbi:hypothetical protein [Methylobacterium planeticum]|uniref:Uncharacterized protein n=1 Tax=Methylobacterium planeticum TaxID=2615211 RepID=A0A6N6MTH7_9HYPH|nr:hypothetical protein [Methylobacterium planeticum]KAB1073640.1 hypothetical protein F6X51_10625 [Methylobacterium planeticum]
MDFSDQVHVILVDRASLAGEAQGVLCFAVRCATADEALTLVRGGLAFGEAARDSGIRLSVAEGKALNLQSNRPKLITELLAKPLPED